MGTSSLASYFLAGCSKDSIPSNHSMERSTPRNKGEKTMVVVNPRPYLDSLERERNRRIFDKHNGDLHSIRDSFFLIYVVWTKTNLLFSMYRITLS